MGKYWKTRENAVFKLLWIFVVECHIIFGNSCEFLPIGEYLRFVRIPENFPVGERLLTIKIHNKQNLSLESIDKGDDTKYFSLSEVNEETIDIKLIKSLENIIDHDKNILKFRLFCFPEDSEMAPNFLSISIFIEDINNHPPKFLNSPYYVTVDELTPTGLTVFRGISAVDLDKPNTPNSDITYSIIDGNQEGKFELEGIHNPGLIVKRPLDYDNGDKSFQLVIMAADRGSPSFSSNATVFVTVKDNDDLPVAFKKSVYKTKITEFYPITNETIRQELKFVTPIEAFDQDRSLNSPVIYEIVDGNDLGCFEMNPTTGKLYLICQLDREKLSNDVIDLSIRAKQVDIFQKFGMAKVIVEVMDLNENLPQFEHLVYNISIMENLPNGFSVLQVYAMDADKGENAEFLYKLEDERNAFRIDETTGWLTVKDETKLDREKIASIELKVYAEEILPNVANNGKKINSRAIVRIGLLDANDNSPVFTPSNLFHFQITLDAEVGSVVGQVTAEDADVESTGNGKVLYELQKSNLTTEEVPFEIDTKTGYIFLLERPLPKVQYTLLVDGSDQPSNPSEKRHSLAVVQIDVVKASRRHSPEFVGSPYEFWVGTTVGIGTSVGQVKVKDVDTKHTVYDLLHSYYEGVPFAIEERTGIIAVVDELTKFSRHHYDFEAYVTDSRHTLTTNVSIHVVDPVHIVSTNSIEPIELSIRENVGGAVLANLKKLIYKTVKETRKMEFLLANYEVRDKFAISSDGTVYTLKELDREEESKYSLTVITQTRGVIQGQGVYQVIIHVTDENDNKPLFDRSNYEGRVRENSPPGTPVTMDHSVRVTDRDDGVNAQFRFEIKGDGWDRFRVDPTNGKIYIGNILLDREEKAHYTLELVATDTGNLSSIVPLRIQIDDINDNAPTFNTNIVLDPPDLDSSQGLRELLRSSASQPMSVEISNSEPIRIPESIEIGTKIARVLAYDRDSSENAIVFYRIVSENRNVVGEPFIYLPDKHYQLATNKEKHFNIDKTSGEISVSKTLKPNTEYALNISASDRGGLRSHTRVRVIVYDVNNFQPVFKKSWYSFEVVEGTKGSIGRVLADDRDSEKNGAISYSIRSKNGKDGIPFLINKDTGEISVDGELDREIQDKYTLEAVAADGGSPQMVGVVEINVEVLDRNDNKPVFYQFMTKVQGANGELIPVYKTSVIDNVLPGTLVTQVFVNDSDSTANGNGLVLLHLADHHREFYINSKNGSITTVSKLDYEMTKEYNLTVIASDLGKPSLSSTAWVLVRVIDSGDHKTSKIVTPLLTERIFDKEVYVYKIHHGTPLPFLLTIMNVTKNFRQLSNEFELVGEALAMSKFKIDSITGGIFIMEILEEGRVYEFLVRVYNEQVKRSSFETQKKQSGVTDMYLDLNEALIRVRRIPHIQPKFSKPVTILTHEPSPEAAEPAIITRATPRPRILYGKNHQSSPPNVTTTTEEAQRTAHIYVGEVAVLTLSSVIFLGGLIAAITVACVRRKRRHRRHLTRLPILPAEVRLQKQFPTSRIANGPARPVLFPMALPGEPMMMMEDPNSSDQTSDTYTDSGDIMSHRNGRLHKDTYALQSAGFSICPDCQKLRKPARNYGREIGGSDVRDRGPMNKFRVYGGREISLLSSHDSGIEHSAEAHCNCCQTHLNLSSDSSGRIGDQFDDSLSMQQSSQVNRNPGVLNKKCTQTQGNVKNNLNFIYPTNNTKSNRPERMVIL